MLGRDIIVINSETIAEDLLGKRSLNYSDRMSMSKMLETYGHTFDTALLNHDNTWRGHRRVLQQSLRPEAVTSYQPIQLRCTAKLLDSLEDSPESWWKHIQLFSGYAILGVIYDHEMPSDPGNDFIYQAANMGVELGIIIASPGLIALATAFPFLKHTPTWFPGGRWINAANSRKHMKDFVDVPFNTVMKRMARGEAGTCLVADALARFGNTDKVSNAEQAIREACATAYGAGGETTASTLTVFTLAMVLYPHVQARAQEEIAAVVGKERLPDFNDRPALPYIEAVLRETLRWRPVVPLAIPHAATNDDIYNGYVIPKGAVIIPNVWAMARNTEKYPSPDTFDPDRFFDSNGKLNEDTPDFAFGFGRRICPGRYLALGSVWIAMAQVLASFSIEKEKDSAGNLIEPNPGWTHGVTSFPRSFPCNFVAKRE